MRVYAAGERHQIGRFTQHIAPAAHVGAKAACPADWFDEEGNPRNFTVTFEDGVAEVDDQIGRYLTAYKMARKTRLIIPAGVQA